MDFKIKLFNSEHLNDIDTRRLKIDVKNFILQDFLLYLKSLHDIGDAETIYVCWKNGSNWILLSNENDWNALIDKFDSKAIVRLNIYYGNVHCNVTCDICANMVIGDRHKCLQCDDFDICQICFQAKPNCHKQHCFLLLRTPEDSIKYLRSIPWPSGNGISDFRVLDIDFDRVLSGVSRRISETQTEEYVHQTPMETDGTNAELSHLSSVVKEGQAANCSSIPQDYYERLPSHIHDALNQLKSMGFENMDGPLIALLIEKNGNICDVVEELEYSLKNK